MKEYAILLGASGMKGKSLRSRRPSEGRYRDQNAKVHFRTGDEHGLSSVEKKEPKKTKTDSTSSGRPKRAGKHH
jgi:hypothetical protein